MMGYPILLGRIHSRFEGRRIVDYASNAYLVCPRSVDKLNHGLLSTLSQGKLGCRGIAVEPFTVPNYRVTNKLTCPLP